MMVVTITIDIGGGSTELALGNKDGVYWSRSLSSKGVRLQSMSDEGPQRVWKKLDSFGIR